MKIEEQVLSIKQIHELQKLGFDVEKYASVEVNITTSNKQYIVSYSFFKLYPEFGDDDVIERYSTMTIGDIINVLPETIITEYYGENIRSHIEINKKVVCYPCYDKNGEVSIMLFHSMQENLIDSLFDCLVWCIKEKHIEL